MVAPYLNLLAHNPESYVNYYSDFISQASIENFGWRIMTGILTSDPELAKLLLYINSQLAFQSPHPASSRLVVAKFFWTI